MKKLLSLVLCLMLLLSCVSAFAADRPVEEDTSNYTEIGNYAPLCVEPETLTVVMKVGASVEDITTNTFCVNLNESTNVQVNWIGIPEAAWTEQRNLMMADGNYPDIMLCTGWSNTDIAKYADEGVLMPLNYYIENCMPGYQNFLSSRPTLYEQTISPDGNIYALANGNNCYHAYCGEYKAFVASSFLGDAAYPQTTDELYDMLVKFRDSDANKDGEANEVPLSGVSEAVRCWLVNSFVYDPISNAHCYINDGKVVCGYTSDAYREALRFIHKLYTEGLIDKTFLTTTANDIKALVSNESGNQVGMLIANTNNIYATAGTEQYYDFMNMMAPVAGPEGVRYQYWNYENHTYNAAVIFSSCKKPELAARWLDNFYSNWELCFNSRFGFEGVKWAWCEEGELALDGTQAVWKKLTGLDIDTLQNFYWGGNDINGAFDHTTQANDAVGMEGFLYAGVQTLEPYKPDYSMYLSKRLWLDADDSADLAQYEVDLNNCMNSNFSDFVKGDKDIDNDADWNAYLNQLQMSGLEDYIALLQKGHDNK